MLHFLRFFHFVCFLCVAADNSQYRVLKGIFQHLTFSKRYIPPDIGPASLFLPVINPSHAPPWECDYNLHKSNSTYFSDLDVTRAHLVCCLLQPGIDALKNNKRTSLVVDSSGKKARGRWAIILGGTTCSFRREIAIYEGYEMWSRMLCWDKKWIYIVTHFVRQGKVKPNGYILGDGSWFGGRNARFVRRGNGDGQLDEENIMATALSRYVVKLGRLTIHPEVLLETSGLLPEKPGGWYSMASPSDKSTPGGEEDTTNDEELNKHDSNAEDENSWDWKRTMAKNKKGLQYAEGFAGLDGLTAEFSGNRTPALARFKDLF